MKAPFLALAVLFSVTVVGVTSSFAAPDQPAPTAAQEGASQTYILGPSDVVEVSVLGRADFTTRDRVGEDGTIRVPFLGVVKAANKTTVQLADELGKALDGGGYFTHPIVKVDVISYASRYVTVLGDFNSPGLVPVDRAYRLSEIIARVGGVKDVGADFVIFRPRLGEARQISIRALATGDLNDDPFVSPGDKIYSPDAELFYVSGQVKAPGAFAMRQNLTIRMAVARGGGLTDSGSLSRLTITRGGKTLKDVNLDEKVQPGDVIVVGERLF